jgi:hypothetical protein
MTEPIAEEQQEKKLPRRDWILLPALSLATILFLVSLPELIAHLYYQESTTLGEDCMALTEASKNLGGIPNSVCWDKIQEGELTKYRLNSSGYRSDSDFGPKSPGTFRIVVIGSSYAVGDRVPIEDAFATRLAPELSQLTGKKIEILNEGMAGPTGYPSFVALRFKDALAAQPDLILRILTTWDVQMQSVNKQTRVRSTAPPAHVSRISELITKLHDHRWRLVFLMQHFLYLSQSQYVNAFLINGDTNNDTGFLNSELDAEWKKHLLEFDTNDANIEERVKAAGVSMVTVLIPIRSHAAMISMGEWPSGYNPYKLDDELRSVITSHGSAYIDILPDYRTIPNPEQGYYPIEGHLNISGHAIVSRLLAKELTSGAVPALNATNAQELDR